MAYVFVRRDPDQRPQRGAVTILRKVALAVALLAASVVTAQAGGLWEKLFTGTGTPRMKAPGSPGGSTLATVRLTIEGMVCYG